MKLTDKNKQQLLSAIYAHDKFTDRLLAVNLVYIQIDKQSESDKTHEKSTTKTTD